MSQRRRRLISTYVGAVTAGLLVSGSVLPIASHAAGPPAPGRPEVASPAVGAYLDYGADGVRRIAGMQRWLGGTELRVGHTYLPGDVWSNIEGAPSFLGDWAEWRKARADRMFVLNVPMLERNEERVRDHLVRRELRRGARGAYDRHFEVLAERLVALGVPDTVIVLGWEMNGTTYTHRCGPDPRAWKAYWKRIVRTMRAVPGQEFRFDFAPNRGRDAIAWTECYPGDDVVDIMGMDSYDQPPGRTFEEQVNEPFGLRHHVEFAAEHGKVISYPEWGLFRNGDNPAYMRGMLEWIEEHRPLYHTLTDYCPHGVWQCEENPRSSDVFRSTLYGRTPEPRPEPEPEPSVPVEPEPEPSDPVTPVPDPVTEPAPKPEPEPEPGDPLEPGEPAEPEAPDDCAALNLSSWIEALLGKRVCLAFEDWRRRLS
ncbi:glycosyl hydrolase [Streptomyces sp. NBC_01498]|uniref:glycoside hydrolase family 26 protein n=1 Tax=Streptomyces sp. NBC_01498 TaxID=2975870 RepID=UPI002E7C0A3E|nr:glycosyl hydrolase [Streptomyces sp. NBC_01498]WTL26375.1 glycosyl hydrolase [Streptomyces sp. NBC_01498]